MADYYPVLARAVSGLAKNDAQARRDLYARARTIVNEQLRNGGRNAAVEVLREQAALESAIGRIEADARSARLGMNGKTAAPPVGKRAGMAPAERAVENTTRSLSKILQAVQSDETAHPRLPARKPVNGERALVPVVEANALAPLADRRTKAPSELGMTPGSLVSMLFGLGYVVAALAFTGVTYIRCMVWLAQDVIGYPILLAVMAATLALFIAPPWLMFRKTSLPTIDMLLRLIYSASRRRAL